VKDWQRKRKGLISGRSGNVCSGDEPWGDIRRWKSRVLRKAGLR
jgi:hypothetical protein